MSREIKPESTAAANAADMLRINNPAGFNVINDEIGKLPDGGPQTPMDTLVLSGLKQMANQTHHTMVNGRTLESLTPEATFILERLLPKLPSEEIGIKSKTEQSPESAIEQPTEPATAAQPISISKSGVTRIPSQEPAQRAA